MSPPKNPVSNSNGSAIILVIIMTALLAVMTMNYVDMLSLFSKATAFTTNRTFRAISLEQIQTIISTTSSLLESAEYLPENNAISACVRGGSVGTCTQNCCQGNVISPLWIVDPMDTTPNIRNRNHFSGPPQSPVYYREDGTSCTPVQNRCAYKLTSQFTAHCPAGANTCDHAEHIQIDVFLTPEPNFPLVRERKYTYYYFPKLNYQPSLPAIANQIVATSQSLTLDLVGDSGHLSELQNFVFSQCSSSQPAVAKVTCLSFEKGAVQVIIEGLAAGNSTISLQIDDRSGINNLSEVRSFGVTVGP